MPDPLIQVANSTDKIIMKTKIFIGLFALFMSFSNCTTDYFGFSGPNSEELSSVLDFQPVAVMTYCNRFDKEGFRGTITAYYDHNQDEFDTNKARLYLRRVPSEFTYPPTNYIQMHPFYIANNKTVFKESPANIEVINNSTNDKLAIITTLGQDFINEKTNAKSINDFLRKYSLILEDMSVWQGVALSVFDGRNKPLKTAQVLIPPFEANPQTYLENQNNERRLTELHPFQQISHINANDKVFYEKGLDFCEDAPIEFEVPDFATHADSAGSSVDQLLEELSLLPEF